MEVKRKCGIRDGERKICAGKSLWDVRGHPRIMGDFRILGNSREMWDQGWGKENPFGIPPWNKGGSGILGNSCWELCWAPEFQEIHVGNCAMKSLEFQEIRVQEWCREISGMFSSTSWTLRTAGIGGWGWNPREIQLEFREYGERREGMAQNESGMAQDRVAQDRDGTG